MGNTQTEKVTETQICLKSGQTVTIERVNRAVMNGGMFSTGQSSSQLGAALAVILGVPFNDQQPMTLSDGIEEVKQAVMGGGFVAGSPTQSPVAPEVPPTPTPAAAPIAPSAAPVIPVIQVEAAPAVEAKPSTEVNPPLQQ